MSTSIDCTERKLAEDALHDLEEHHRTLSDSSFEAIFLSHKGICLNQNLTAGKMFGYTLEEAVGRPGTDWIVPEGRDTVMRHMLAGDESPYETVALCKDGTTFPVEIQGRMFKHKDMLCRVTALRDITDRKRTEEEKQKLESHLRNQQKLESIGTLAGGVAHEINNPINIIMNYADLIMHGTESGTEPHEFAGTIFKEGQRIADIVKSLLSFSRQVKK